MKKRPTVFCERCGLGFYSEVRKDKHEETGNCMPEALDKSVQNGCTCFGTKEGLCLLHEGNTW